MLVPISFFLPQVRTDLATPWQFGRSVLFQRARQGARRCLANFVWLPDGQFGRCILFEQSELQLQPHVRMQRSSSVFWKRPVVGVNLAGHAAPSLLP
jgi:hypothetical protein